MAAVHGAGEKVRIAGAKLPAIEEIDVLAAKLPG
jgi:hypothetical protein